MAVRAAEPSHSLILVKKPESRHAPFSATSASLAASVGIPHSMQPSRVFRGIAWGMIFNFVLAAFAFALWQTIRHLPH